MSHQECAELLAAYSVHAVPASEQGAVELHLDSCAICQRELDDLRETSSVLAFSVEEPPESVWRAISENIESGLNVFREASPFPLDSRRRGHGSQWIAGIAAALLICVGVGTIWLNVDDSNTKTDIVAEAARAVHQPGAHAVALKSADGALRANAVLLPDGSGYLSNVNLPALPPDRAYQLWAMNGTSPISAGILGASPATVTFVASGDVGALAISEEPKGGSVAPTSSPLVSGLV